ncbi:MAG: lipopolysaccharide transport periplasmic protein LptA [Mailhella sp.]|nr:lipopolysaccharide transport periplasmic protein LptA [Mailhella sp.]
MKKCLAMLAFVLCCQYQAQAAPLPVSSEGPVDVTSDAMVYNSDKNTVVFKGNVEAVRGEFKMWSELLTIYLASDGKEKSGDNSSSLTSAMGGNDVDRIVAEKNVRFENGTQHGSASKATYFARPNTLVLEGSPVLHDGDNSISGNVIRYFVNENRSVVEGAPQRRVHAIFSSKEKKKGK